MNDGWWWLSSRKMTVCVGVRRGRVAEGPPIVRVFLGQPLDNLRRWLQRQGGYKEEKPR